MNEEESIELLKALLARENAEWSEEGACVRFRVRHGGMTWETVCRPVEEALLFYARFPFRCRDAETARLRCEELNRRLVRGALFLGEDGGPVYRCRAELDDVYGAEDRIISALRYSAEIMAHYWGRLSTS